jgi:hypothetical protein
MHSKQVRRVLARILRWERRFLSALEIQRFIRKRVIAHRVYHLRLDEWMAKTHLEDNSAATIQSAWR